jgi:hypothetical protein
MSGFLRGAAQTAAGVAAGTLAIQGIESLFSHHSGFGGGQGLFGGGGIGGYGSGETVIENNYYGGNSDSGHHQSFADADSDLGPRDADFQSQDVSDDDTTNVDDSNYDDSSDDNSGSDLDA